MNAVTAKLAVNFALLVALLAPPVATVVSPQFPMFASSVVANPATYDVQLEALRRATPLWSGGIGLYNTALYQLGVSPNPGQMVMGKDGYMFLGNNHAHIYDQIIHRYTPTQEQIDAWVDTLAFEESYLRARGIRMLFVVAPSSGTIYADKIANVPSGFMTRPTVFDRIIQAAAHKNLPLLDVRAELIEGRKVADTYTKLNSHWNDFGAYLAWRKAALWIEKAVPGVKMAGTDNHYTLETVNAGNEAMNLLNIDVPNEWVRVKRETPFPTYYLITPGGAKLAISGETPTGFLELPRETISPDATSAIRALVFTDSMGASMSPYWHASFKELKQVNHHVQQPPAKFDFITQVNEYKPNLVLYLMTERYFAFPLGDVNEMQMQEAFTDFPEMPQDQVWPALSGQPAPKFLGNSALSEPANIVIDQISPSKRYMKLSVFSSGPGQIYVSYQVDGKTIERWYTTTPGENDIMVSIPERIDGGSILAFRDANQSPVTLTEIRIRGASKDF